MKTLVSAWPVVLLALVSGGCRTSTSDGYGVALTIVYDSTVSDAQVATVRAYDFAFSGAETDVQTVSVTTARRTERVLIRPSVASGILTIAIEARDAAAQPLARGSAAVMLRSGSLAEATLSLSVVNFGDMTAPPSDAHVPDLGLDLELTLDLAATADLASETNDDLAASEDLTLPADLANADLLLPADLTPAVDLTPQADLLPPPCGTGTFLAASPGSYLAIDGANVYFIASDGLRKIPKGGGASTLLTSSVGSNPWSMATDGTHVYWTVFASKSSDGNVFRISTSGGTRETVATGGADYPMGIAINSASVFYTTNDSQLWRVPLAGGTPTSVGSASGSARYVALDGTNAYWSTWSNGNLRQVPLGGGTIVPLSSDATRNYNGVAVAGSTVFVVAQSAGVFAVPIGGGTVSSLSTVGGFSLVTDGTHLFWATSSYIGKMAVGGGAVTQIGLGTSNSYDVAVDGSFVYWTARNVAICKASK